MTINGKQHVWKTLPFRIYARAGVSAAIFLILLMAVGCGGPLYKVAPLPASGPAVPAASAGLSVGARALDGDSSLEQFEANLPMAGVVAVDFAVRNFSAGPISLRSLKFDLRDDAGSKIRQIPPKKALGRVMKFYGNNFYPLESRKITLESYESVGFKPSGSLDSSGEVRGFLFFEAPKGAGLSNLTLSVTGTGSPVTIRLSAK